MTITQKLIKLKKNSDHDYDKYIVTLEFNKLTAEKLTARIAQENLGSNCDIATFIKNTDFDDKLKNMNKKVNQIKQNIY